MRRPDLAGTVSLRDEVLALLRRQALDSGPACPTFTHALGETVP